MKNTCKLTPGCDKPRLKRPGNSSMYFPGCMDCQIAANLSKHREEVRKDKAELEIARETVKKGSPVTRFYKSAAWLNFSRYVLLYYADDDLEVRCSTDPSLWYPINKKEICVGHYLKVFDTNSTNFATAFDFRNVGPQSTKENNAGGNMAVMAQWIEDTHGAGTVEELKQIRRNAFKLDKYTLDEISKKYLALFNEELKRRNIKNPWR